MQTETIITTLLAAAALLKQSVQTAACETLSHAYEAAKDYLRRKLGEGTEAAKALELTTNKPESEVRKALLLEEIASADLENDPELARLIDRLSALVPPSPRRGGQNIRVAGRGNTVQVAGRDLITTARLVRRSAITPDERHLSATQRASLRGIMAALAQRLAGEEGRPNFAAVHRLLQRHFGVASYLLIPRERQNEARDFLCRQCAMHRSRLRQRNPSAYEGDFFRAIHARREALGWDKPRLRRFALEKLALKRPIASLKELGPIQLKSLAALMHREVAGEAITRGPARSRAKSSSPGPRPAR